MSLSLVQDYSSEEEREDEEPPVSDDDDGGRGEDGERELRADPLGTGSGIRSARVPEVKPPSTGFSLLPTPEDLFSEVTGPPEFLKSANTEPLYTRANNSWQPSSSQRFRPAHRSDLGTDSEPGVVLETNANSTGSHKILQAGSEHGIRKETAGFVAGAGAAVSENISATPRPYIGAEMKPTTDAEKRSRSKIKDKEKNKRMKGQSSHATWKSETEMQLRQQFD